MFSYYLDDNILVSPSAIAHDAIALLKEYEEPKNKREIGLLADMPAVHYNRKVIPTKISNSHFLRL